MKQEGFKSCAKFFIPPPERLPFLDVLLFFLASALRFHSCLANGVLAQVKTRGKLYRWKPLRLKPLEWELRQDEPPLRKLRWGWHNHEFRDQRHSGIPLVFQ